MKQIPLRARDGSIRAHTLVDDTDFDWLNQWTWRLKAKGYAGRSVGRQALYMHRLILGLDFDDPRQGDHENRNRLDNRRENLRIAERAGLDNQQNRGAQTNNTSGYRGVSWRQMSQTWMAQATIGGKRHYLGLYTTAEEANEVVKVFRAENMLFSID
jgi:hypothetical protein